MIPEILNPYKEFLIKILKLIKGGGEAKADLISDQKWEKSKWKVDEMGYSVSDSLLTC